MDLYREEILEHWQNPHNFGKMRGADLVIEQVNPLCGDAITFFFKIEGGKIKDVSFEGSGCAISIASASMLSGVIKNKPVAAISKITGKNVLNLIGADRSSFPPARLKCAFLSLEAVRQVTSSKLVI